MIPCCNIDCREWKVDYTRSQHILDGATALPRYSHEESINNQYWRGVRRRSPRPARVTTDRPAGGSRAISDVYRIAPTTGRFIRLPPAIDRGRPLLCGEGSYWRRCMMMMWTRGVTRGDLPLRFTVRRRGGESVSVARVDLVNSFIHACVWCL